MNRANKKLHVLGVVLSLIVVSTMAFIALGRGAFATPDHFRASSFEKYSKYEVKEVPITIPEARSKIVVEDKNAYADTLRSYAEATLRAPSVEVVCVYRLKEGSGVGEALIRVDGGYFLVKLSEDRPIAHARLEPVLVKRDAVVEELVSLSASALNVEAAVAKLVKERIYEVYELRPEQEAELAPLATLYAVTAEVGVETKNFVGWTLWRLAAKSTTYVWDWVVVLSVNDESYYWVNPWFPAWRCENFYHYAEVKAQSLYSYTWAEGDFVYEYWGEVWQRFHAWAWVRTWYNGYVEGNAGA